MSRVACTRAGCRPRALNGMADSRGGRSRKELLYAGRKPGPANRPGGRSTEYKVPEVRSPGEPAREQLLSLLSTQYSVLRSPADGPPPPGSKHRRKSLPAFVRFAPLPPITSIEAT